MAFSMEENEPANPIDVNFFRSNGIAFRAQLPANAIKQLRRGSNNRIRGGHVVSMSKQSQLQRRKALGPEGTSQRSLHHRARDCSIHLLLVRLKLAAARETCGIQVRRGRNYSRAPTSVPEICGTLIKRRRAR